MKFHRFFMFGILMFIIASCTSTGVDSKDNACSAENPKGKCETGKVCVLAVCHDVDEICSDANQTGLCDEGFFCHEGSCQDEKNFACSPEFPKGKCEDGKACLNGYCIDSTELCSEDNLTGKCETGKLCYEGNCKDISEYCSPSNLTGLCTGEKTCIDGSCKNNSDLCSEDNPTGLCKKDYVCNSGVCVEKSCDDGSRRNCYPQDLDQSQINKGICREGIQICASGEWGACKSAITPQEEVCDGVDNNCDGNIDEGVKNRCGDCRPESELPAEIQGNNIDDDCDGLIDENEDNTGGLENCDGRMHQPCYNGPVGTSGKGVCHGGFRDCTWDDTLNAWTVWGACEGEVTPSTEVCGDNLDNNCDGIIDENCQSFECKDEEICGNNLDDDCNDLIDDGCSVDIEREECVDEEICNNGFDDDCDGVIDNGCSCAGLNEVACFSGDPSMLNHGENTQCKAGVAVCIGGESWGSCDAQVLPSVEICDGIDNDCDGIVDNQAVDGNACGNCTDEVPVEICGNNIDDNCDSHIDENCDTSTCDNPQEEVCDGVDNDCDGLVDEGVLNACGKCDESCNEINIGGSGNTCAPGQENYPACKQDIEDGFDDGTFDGVGVDEDGNVTLDTTQIENNFIWIANSGNDQVTKINTITGERFGPFNVCNNPSRTAVTRDGGVWIACRDDHKVTKLAPDGTLMPGFPVQLVSGCGPRGMAIDKDGYGWVGCYGASYQVYKISEDGTIQTGFPVNSGSSTYGLAIDSRGLLWNSGRASSKNFRIDTSKSPSDADFIKLYNKVGNPYGVVIDQNNDIWYANYAGSSSNTIIRFQYNEVDQTVSTATFPSGEGQGGRGLAVDNRGHVWVAYSGSVKRLCEYDSAGTVLHCYNMDGTTPVGVGIDSEEDVWVVTYHHGAREYKYDADNPDAVRTYTSHDLGSGLVYTYSDMTGYNLRNITAPTGLFTLVQDTGYAGSAFDSIKVIGATPNNSQILVKVQVSEDNNNWSDWSHVANFVDSSTVMDLTWDGAKPKGRYVKIEVTLKLGDDNTKPSFSQIVVNWQRP